MCHASIKDWPFNLNKLITGFLIYSKLCQQFLMERGSYFISGATEIKMSAFSHEIQFMRHMKSFSNIKSAYQFNVSIF